RPRDPRTRLYHRTRGHCVAPRFWIRREMMRYALVLGLLIAGDGALAAPKKTEAPKKVELAPLVAAINGADMEGAAKAAAAAAARGHNRQAIDALFELLARGEDPAVKALAQLADPDLAAKIADHLGQVPDAALAKCLGAILVRPDFGPDPARVEVVRALT